MLTQVAEFASDKSVMSAETWKTITTETTFWQKYANPVLKSQTLKHTIIDVRRYHSRTIDLHTVLEEGTHDAAFSSEFESN
ncbi:tail fiber protein [Salmonella phage 18-India]|nr:tail fiber protein [Salmonella phage 18-India]